MTVSDYDYSIARALEAAGYFVAAAKPYFEKYRLILPMPLFNAFVNLRAAIEAHEKLTEAIRAMDLKNAIRSTGKETK